MKKLIILFILLFAVNAWGAATSLSTCQGSNEICFCDYSDNSSCDEGEAYWNGYATFTALLAGEDALASDDIVDVGDGAVYRETWTLDGSGTDGHPITIRAKTGDSPIISGADLIAPGTSWAADEITETWGENTGDDHSASTIDTLVRGGANGGNNYGGEVYVQIKDYDLGDNDNARKGFYSFDLSGGTGTVTAGSIYIRRDTSGTGAVTGVTNLCTRTWVEGTATWDHYNGADAWGANHDESTQLDSMTFPDAIGYMEITDAAVLTAIQNAYGSGALNISVKTDDSTLVTLSSSEDDDTQRPYVSITTGTSGVWKTGATITTEPNMVFFDGTLGNQESAVGDVDAEYDWYWAGDILYVYGGSDGTKDPDTEYTSPGIEHAVRDKVIDSDGEDYLTFSGLTIKYANGEANATGALHIVNSTNVMVSDCIVSYAGRAGIQGSSSDDLLLEDSTIEYTGQDTAKSGLYLGSSTGLKVSGCTFDNCAEHGIYMDALDGDGGSIDYIKENIFSNNTVYGIQTNANDAGWITTTGESCISYNIFADNSKGMNLNSVDGLDVFGNVVYGSTKDTSPDMYFGYNTIEDPDGTFVAKNCNAYNNTFYCTSGIKYGWRIAAGTDNITIKNNIFYSTSGKYFGRLENQDVANGVPYPANYTLSNNCYYGGAGWYWKDDSTTTTFTTWQGKEGGLDANSKNVDPLFTNAGGDDFTLKHGSPCRHGATYLSGYETKLRPEGSWPSSVTTMDDILSIGAYGIYRGSAGM